MKNNIILGIFVVCFLFTAKSPAGNGFGTMNTKNMSGSINLPIDKVETSADSRSDLDYVPRTVFVKFKGVDRGENHYKYGVKRSKLAPQEIIPQGTLQYRPEEIQTLDGPMKDALERAVATKAWTPIKAPAKKGLQPLEIK